MEQSWWFAGKVDAAERRPEREETLKKKDQSRETGY